MIDPATGLVAWDDGLDNPLPNPPPGPGDEVVSRVVSARGALRRSLVLWGWGQLAAGDGRGWLGPPAQALAIGALTLAVPHAAGVAAPLVYLAAAFVMLLWVAIAVHAWHRARRRRLALGSGPGGGAHDLLWLAPIAVVLGAGFWVVSGTGADPVLTLDAYLAEIGAGRVDAAAGRWSGVDAAAVGDGSARQSIALRNVVVRVVAEDPAAEADADHPLRGLRWRFAGPAATGGRTYVAEVVRSEPVRTQLFGILPTTAQRLVPVEAVGRVELRPVEVASGGPFGPVVAWRIVRLELGGEVIGPGG